ncbi:MAG: hypothetical protein MAG795_00497 [Candidatus Woesearchaeota archaeon]|nr:hypothetical protein [Candidatus Woesearchaeota archaeon]
MISTALKHYKRKEIQEAIVRAAKDKEIATRYGNRGFGKRPDILQYPRDVFESAKQGATSFHASEELWNNPLQLDVSLARKQLDNLRKGWDLVLDIDCAALEYSRIAADLLFKALNYYKIKSVSCKFSGNKGFHLGVPFEAFPEEVAGQNTKLLFPDGARAIALYLRDMIKTELEKKIMALEGKDLDKIAKRVKLPADKVTAYAKTKSGIKIKKLNVDAFLEIDTVLISSRHLYRMPYSLHEKSLLVSVPIDPRTALTFDKSQAKPANVKVSDYRFLDRTNIRKGEARQLLVQALDYQVKVYVKPKEERVVEVPEDAIPEKFFPPCMNLGLKGLKDGRKRFMFCLMNFLKSCGWSHEQIEQRVRKWNKKNPEHLRPSILEGQLKYRKHRPEVILPPNCQNLSYYSDIRICKPDNLCKKIKNPVQYSKRKIKYL